MGEGRSSCLGTRVSGIKKRVRGVGWGSSKRTIGWTNRVSWVIGTPEGSRYRYGLVLFAIHLNHLPIKYNF